MSNSSKTALSVLYLSMIISNIINTKNHLWSDRVKIARKHTCLTHTHTHAHTIIAIFMGEDVILFCHFRRNGLLPSPPSPFQLDGKLVVECGLHWFSLYKIPENRQWKFNNRLTPPMMNEIKLKRYGQRV